MTAPRPTPMHLLTAPFGHSADKAAATLLGIDVADTSGGAQ